MPKDQAAHLRHKIDEKSRLPNHQVHSYPSRSEIHQHKKKKTKWKISFPLIRLLLLLFIVIILMFLTIKFWGNEYLSSAETETSHSSFDQVELKLKNNNQTDYQVHVVESKESLFSISTKYYGSREYVQEIIDMNEINNQELIVGQKLIIPVIAKD